MMTLESALEIAVGALAVVSGTLWKRCGTLEDRHAKFLEKLANRASEESEDDDRDSE